VQISSPKICKCIEKKQETLKQNITIFLDKVNNIINTTKDRYAKWVPEVQTSFSK